MRDFAEWIDDDCLAQMQYEQEQVPRCAAFNAAHPVGTVVTWKPTLPGTPQHGISRRLAIREPAAVTNGQPSIWLDRWPGRIHLDDITEAAP